ncbi:MAG: phosphoglycerate dehydrogenase [Candidatus Magasanikbacteria bacterium]|nr:phosphoglycerate dehydrogenase [Candidatus Magasanikbacteria bacterium]
MNTKIIIDFDSTFVKVETLDELAKIVLVDNPNQKELIEQISAITSAGMRGEIGFKESLARRLALFCPRQRHLKQLIIFLRGQITSSVVKNKDFFMRHANDIYLISGGFKEYIFPVVKEFGIREDHIIANNFETNDNGEIVAYNRDHPLAQDNGKSIAVKNLKLVGTVQVIGDGYTDYQIKQSGAADKFFAFTENVSRPEVMALTDQVLTNFEEFIVGFENKKSEKRIALLLEKINSTAQKKLYAAGYEVKSFGHALTEDELMLEIQSVSILGIRSKTKITRAILEQADQLKIVGAFCIGTDQIDMEACRERDITIFNAPFSSTKSVVELALAEIIMLQRKIVSLNIQTQSGNWAKTTTECHELTGKKLGIIGFGRIGSQLSLLAEILGMNVIYYDCEDKLPVGRAQACASLNELLGLADIVTLHVDGRPENKNLISGKELKLMQPSAKLLNLSRGSVVNIPDLANAIKNGVISGAAIDVYPTEPTANGPGFYSELQNLPNVILTPHIGGSTIEAQEKIAEFVCDKILNHVNQP